MGSKKHNIYVQSKTIVKKSEVRDISLSEEYKNKHMKMFDRKKKSVIWNKFINDNCKLNVYEGTYFIKYTDNNGDISFVKMIKL